MIRADSAFADARYGSVEKLTADTKLDAGLSETTKASEFNSSPRSAT